MIAISDAVWVILCSDFMLSLTVADEPQILLIGLNDSIIL